jgi:flagellar P-ring protein precursor FlgI
VPRTAVKVDTGDRNKLALVREGVSLRELVDGLNALGIGPREKTGRRAGSSAP